MAALDGTTIQKRNGYEYWTPTMTLIPTHLYALIVSSRFGLSHLCLCLSYPGLPILEFRCPIYILTM